MGKLSNPYASLLKNFDAIPKEVLAAVAVSFSSCHGDYLDAAEAFFLQEWWTLFDNGIVAQRPNISKRELALRLKAADKVCDAGE